MKGVVITVIFSLFIHFLNAQVLSDSLLLVINKTVNDTLLASLHQQAGQALKKEGKLEQSIAQYKKSLALYRKQGNHKQVAKRFNNLGGVYSLAGVFELALESYLNSLKLYEELADPVGQVKSHINLGNFFARQQKYNKAEGHYEQALALLDPEDLKHKALLHMNLGGINTEPKNQEADINKALVNYQKATELFTRLNDTYNLAGIANNIGVVKEQQGRLQEAYASYAEALELRKQLQDLPGISQSYHNLGNIKRKQGALEQADQLYATSLKVAVKTAASKLILNALQNLSVVYAEMGRHQKAFVHRLQYDSIKESLYNEEKSRQLAELETKYETAKKDQELQVIEASVRQKTAERNTIMMTLVITIILSLVVIIIYHQRQKVMEQLALKNQELYNHQISEMLKEQEIKSIHAMLEGQDRERKRIAEDLHDRLGSTLSAVKLHLNALDGNILPNMPAPLVQNLNGLLDQAVDEVRDIAHNMVSGVLAKFGLTAALHDLKGSIEASRQIKVDLLVLNLDERLEGTVEINLYRIIQELVSNILRHANAGEITIQLNKFGQELLLMVEDNGKGFDPSLASQDRGMGLRNVASRVDALGGRLSIDSGRGRGTTTTIEIPLA